MDTGEEREGAAAVASGSRRVATHTTPGSYWIQPSHWTVVAKDYQGRPQTAYGRIRLWCRSLHARPTAWQEPSEEARKAYRWRNAFSW